MWEQGRDGKGVEKSIIQPRERGRRRKSFLYQRTASEWKDIKNRSISRVNNLEN